MVAVARKCATMRAWSERVERDHPAMWGFRTRIFALTFSWLLSARAEAPSAPGAAGIRIDDCPEELAASLPAVIKLEIDVLLRERGPTRAPPESIQVRCEGPAARIAVTLDGTSRESTIDLAVLAPDHRARAVALAAAELVHSLSNRSRAPTAQPKLAPPPRNPNPESSAPPPAPQSASQGPALLLGGLAEWLGKPAHALIGARLAFLYPLGQFLVPALSLDGALTSFPARSARVSAEAVATGLHLYVETTTRKLRVAAGPGARLGWVHLAGHPDANSTLEGHSLSAAWAGPELRARVTYDVAETRAPLLALELGAGIVALPVRGLVDGTERVYAIEGHWLSLCAELGLSL